MKTPTLRHLAIAVASAAVIASASCSGVRQCAAPELNLPETISGADTDSDSMTIADIEWWEFYTDPALTDIIEEALRNNRDLQAAMARIDEYKALYGVAKANYLPTVSGIAGGTYETNDYHGDPHVSDPEYSLKMTLNWELDLWGGQKWERRGREADFMHTVYNARAIKMELIAEIVDLYFNLIALDNELTIVRRTLTTRQESARMAKIRFEGGLTHETSYRQALVELATTAALIPTLENKITTTQNALTLLMGRYPAESLRRSFIELSPIKDTDLPTGLPSELLTRRPDLQASESRLKSALANVGVKYADRFPRLRIAFTGGWENDKPDGFFKSPFTYTLGNIAGTILDFGRNKRRYQASIAAYEQAKLAYEKNVLTVFKEVSDAAATFRNVARSVELRQRLHDAALKYVELAQIQYRSGILNYIDVLDAQRRYFEAQIGFGNAVRDQYIALANLYKALGGGWK